MVFAEPAIGVGKPLRQTDLGLPAERPDARNLEQLLRRAVGLVRIELEISRKTGVEEVRVVNALRLL